MNQDLRAAANSAAGLAIVQGLGGGLLAGIDLKIEAGLIGTRPLPPRPARVHQHPLERLVDREQITRDQFEAGVELRHDWTWCMGAPPPTTVNYQTGEAGLAGRRQTSDYDPIDLIEAHSRWRWIITRLAPHHWQCLHDVCYLGQAPNSWATGVGMRRSAGVEVLRAALDQLVQLFERYPTEGLGLDASNLKY